MKRKRIVTIGGGTGSFTLLSGLKKYPVDISAIVSMADDGGSTGVLRDELGVLPPGDVRQCLVALSESSEMLRELMNYRFDKGGLKGHSFGNLFISALEKINKNLTEGIEQVTKIFGVRGEVLPVSEQNMRLHIKLKNGKVISGQSQLDHNEEIRKIGLKEVFLKPKIKANKKAIDAILKADMIIMGPGDLYGSVLPNLLVGEISEAIRKSKAVVIYNCNLTNKKGQTDNYSIEDYVHILEKYIGKGRINFVTFNSRKIPVHLVRKYELREGKNSMVVHREEVDRKRKLYKIVMADILHAKSIRINKNDVMASSRSFIRHDSDKLAKLLMMILEFGDPQSIIKEIL